MNGFPVKMALNFDVYAENVNDLKWHFFFVMTKKEKKSKQKPLNLIAKREKKPTSFPLFQHLSNDLFTRVKIILTK